MTELQAIVFTNFNDPSSGRSFYRVRLPDGELKSYEFASAVQMRSYKHIYGALDNPGAYQFFDHDGVLVIQPRNGTEAQP